MGRNRTLPYRTRREARAAAMAQEEMDRLTQLQDLGSSMTRERLATEQNQRAALSFELEAARQAAQDSMRLKDDADEVAALKFLSGFKANKQGADVELDAILAQHPGAARSPLVNKMYADKSAEVALNKKFIEVYSSQTGGIPVPTFEDGSYDMVRADQRLRKIGALQEAKASGLLKEDGSYEKWMATPEEVFHSPDSGFAMWKGKQIEKATAVEKAKTLFKEKGDLAIEQGKTLVGVGEKLRPDPAVVSDPDKFAEQTEKAEELIRLGTESQMTGIELQNTRVAAPSTKPADPADAGESFVTRLRNGLKQNP